MAIYDSYHGGVSLTTTYSIADTRNQFAALIRGDCQRAQVLTVDCVTHIQTQQGELYGIY